ncbi:E3 ubiquitin-protein ligase HERC2 [Bienertia sinuspersici]
MYGAGVGKVYSWGRGTFGRLGNVSETDENFPVQIKWDDANSHNQKPLNFVGVAAGAYHSLALAGKCNSNKIKMKEEMMDQFGAGATTPVLFLTSSAFV